MMIEKLLESLRAGQDLNPVSAEVVVDFLASENGDAITKADLLIALREKGETAVEIAAFASALLDRAVDPGIDPAALTGPAVDVCGTGGDKLGLFNISTTAMFVAAAAGAVVVKHGNRGITSKCGGADVLEALGVRIDLPPAELAERVQRHGVGFLFAPLYHPAFKQIAPVRKQLAERGVRTVFNILGPLLNPARPAYQLVGLFDQGLVITYAKVLAKLGRKKAWVVHGGGADELLTHTTADVAELASGEVRSFVLDPAEWGFERSPSEHLRGGDVAENAEMLVGILEGKIVGARRDVVILNAAAALVVTGLAPDLTAGAALAAEKIDSGAALQKLKALQ